MDAKKAGKEFVVVCITEKRVLTGFKTKSSAENFLSGWLGKHASRTGFVTRPTHVYKDSVICQLEIECG